MATLTIRNLDDALKTRLRVRAAEHHRSMEEEARRILQQALPAPPSAARPETLADAIRRRFANLGGVDLPDTSDLRREPVRDPPPFD